MSFKHKLSRRLAMLFSSSGLAMLAMYACEQPVSLTPPAAEPDRLIVSPKTSTVAPNQDIAFTSVALTAQGDTADVHVTWSATGGNVSDTSTNGHRHYSHWKAGGCGAFGVAATAHPGGQSDTASVSVVCTVPVGSVTVTPPSPTIPQGQTVQLGATVMDTSGNPLSSQVTWASGNSAVATVSSSGLVTGVTAGSATITATSGGQTGSATVTVTPVSVASVAVSPATASVPVGQTVPLTAAPKDANGTTLSGRAVSWTSSNTSVATVDASGLVTGVAVGSATITATSEGQSGSAAVTVAAAPVPVASVAVTPATASIQVGQTVPLTAAPKDANGTTLSGRAVSWTSSNTSVATVDASGLVTGVAVGSATITATSEGKSGSAAVTVTQVPVASVTVSPATATIQVGQTVQLTATPKDASGNPLAGRVVTWASGSTSIATVNASGLVSGVAPGSATITATSEGKSGTAAITVTVVIGTTAVLVGAGDIADCDAEPTAALLDNIAGTVFTAGDNAYSSGSTSDYANCYDPSWGRHKARTRPSPGNHDYNTSGASGYYTYFGSLAGPSGRGYYSYDLGDWHIISLNSNVSMSAGS
ncbi:MAG TPA: Ig-like domain-containing protein, partial [Gemmatimonadales bacterium]|nr:Ig-like domain-containing protein [Gemmatimonadales bacterium]